MEKSSNFPQATQLVLAFLTLFCLSNRKQLLLVEPGTQFLCGHQQTHWAWDFEDDKHYNDDSPKQQSSSNQSFGDNTPFLPLL